ncbi:MAG: 50S ribosomal protein L19 [bacterium]|nr:50S ribosomal protein L19 [bacterium]
MDSIIHKIEAAYKKDDLPSFKAGDRLKVHLRVVEGKNERIQVFEGDVIGIRGRGIQENFTIRKISNGVGVEKIIPMHSPKIDKIEVVRCGRVRRAKLYYLRELSGKKARIKEKMKPRKN